MKIAQHATTQSAQAAAGNGTAIKVDGADRIVFEITGTYTAITANFEGSYDSGVTYVAIPVRKTDNTYVTTLAANGIVAVSEGFLAMTHVRARTTVAGPTGSMTVVVHFVTP